MPQIEAPRIKGSGKESVDVKKQERYARLIKKGYRTVYCPACMEPYTAKNIVEVIVCNKCGYRKIKE